MHDLTVFETGAELDRFWAWVELARRDWDAFAAELRTLDEPTLIRFVWTFQDLAGDVSEAIEDSDSYDYDHDLEDVCGWVVAQGRAFYERCLADPTLAPDELEGVGIDVQYEAATAYRERSGKDPPSY
ncbi:DUF4240 domain-containing protein [Paraliomyxa miuraensis]|uniref:hypothetical protein n=1 Tax=Paraliomyxa miuraensis TaxID=376150 RepID=UPI0022537C32|nr:hypothetical protein [Paraliomyxa miuraensis]MCX4244180.1 DUF4240 domain-containing protein [Paraliomyxa miuraensis]